NQGDRPPPLPGVGEVGLRFTVRDTGIGIPAEQQARIFRAFEQEDTSTTRKYGGTGLGPTIAPPLGALNGGTITAASGPGPGRTLGLHGALRPAAAPLGAGTGSAVGLTPRPARAGGR